MIVLELAVCEYLANVYFKNDPAAAIWSIDPKSLEGRMFPSKFRQIKIETYFLDQCIAVIITTILEKHNLHKDVP